MSLLRQRTIIPTIGAAIALAPAQAFAAATGLPWEAPLTTVVDSLTGPVVTGIAVAAVTVAGLIYAFGEAGSMMRRAAGMILGLAIAIAAPGMITQLFGNATGMPF